MFIQVEEHLGRPRIALHRVDSDGPRVCDEVQGVSCCCFSHISPTPAKLSLGEEARSENLVRVGPPAFEEFRGTSDPLNSLFRLPARQ